MEYKVNIYNIINNFYIKMEIEENKIKSFSN
jgi:hypothetical protein